VAAWFEDDHPGELLRWTVAATAVVGLHAALIASYLLWHPQGLDIGDDVPIVTVELAPIDNTADSEQRDVAPGREDMVEQKATTPKAEKTDQPPTERPPPIPDIQSDVTLPDEKPPEQNEQQMPPAPRTTARTIGGAPRVEPSWAATLVKHLQRFKNYPSAAQARGEQGVVMLRFTVDRNGHVLAQAIDHGSGYAALDAEVTAMLARAQPLPAFPASMTADKLEFTVPIRFALH
jgi:protein TonB